MRKSPKTQHSTSDELSDILANPKAFFADPFDIVTHHHFALEDQKRILTAWKADEEALQRAASESMTGGEPSQLQRVQEALNALDEDPAIPVPPVALVTPLGSPTVLASSLTEGSQPANLVQSQPRTRKQLLTTDRRLIFRFIVGLLLLLGLALLLFGPIVGDDGKISLIGLGVIVFEVIVLCVGLLWLTLVKTSKSRKGGSNKAT